MRIEAPAQLQMWAGIECTLNRVGNRYRDQLETAGHYLRPADIEQIIALGVNCVRYPVLWERHALSAAAWHHSDFALGQLRDAGVNVIVGLVHHGSGPPDTTLLDPHFPRALADFARTVAERYPWVTRFTPVNEPLTTARFAALYGHWYPHHRSDRSFVRALLHQIRGVQESMRAIREVTPGAQLIATEDLGFTSATADLQRQAWFDNERRWLTWDLLTGRVDTTHTLWRYLLSNGASEDELQRIERMAVDERSESMWLGVNHYLTSERFLDSNVDRYPAATRGGNGRQRYSDVEAVRVLRNGPLGVHALLMQTWERFGRPIAVTEAHLACTREQQMLWLDQVWRAACDARAEGADVRAVTAWSAFGAFDWNSLLTRENNAYESGIYKLENGALQATALAAMVSGLATSGSFAHPGLHAHPWWRHDSRLHFDAAFEGMPSDHGSRCVFPVSDSPFLQRPLCVVECEPDAAKTFAAVVRERGLAHVVIPGNVFGQNGISIGMHDTTETDPWAIVHVTQASLVSANALSPAASREAIHAFLDRLLDDEPGVTLTCLEAEAAL